MLGSLRQLASRPKNFLPKHGGDSEAHSLLQPLYLRTHGRDQPSSLGEEKDAECSHRLQRESARDQPSSPVLQQNRVGADLRAQAQRIALASVQDLAV